MADNDLFEALKMFSSGVKEYQLQSAIGDANSYVQQIKAADMSEQQKRSELQSLSNQLVGHLAGIGASGTQISAAAQAVGPKQFASADQAQLEGFLTGNNDLVKFGEQADRASTANQIRLYEKKAEIDLQKQKNLFEHQEKIALLKQGLEKPSGDQLKTAGFAKQLYEAETSFTDLESKGFGRADAFSAMGTLLPNRFQGGDLQRQRQAERRFVNAILRRESGAAISQSEFENAEAQYFPRSGDTAEAIAQKKQNRLSVFGALRDESGNAWKKVGGSMPGYSSSSAKQGAPVTNDGAPPWARFIRK